MRISESEKNRIRGLHRNASVIKEDWGSKKDEYKRTDGHRDGDVDGHYKAYEADSTFNETGDITLDEFWGSNEDEYKRRDGHRTGDVDGHYKAYEGIHEDEFPFAEDEGDVIGAEWQADSDLDKTNIKEDTEGEETYNYGEDEGEDHDEEMDLEHDEDMAPHDRIDAIEKHLDALRQDMSYDEDREDRDERGTRFESYKRRPLTEQFNRIKDLVDEILNKDEDDIEEKDIDVLKKAKKYVNKGVTKTMLNKIDSIFNKAKKKSWGSGLKSLWEK